MEKILEDHLGNNNWIQETFQLLTRSSANACAPDIDLSFAAKNVGVKWDESIKEIKFKLNSANDRSYTPNLGTGI